jgi:hypothetical protein
MSQITIRDQVREAVGMEWPAFEARHPNLASLLDQEAIVERATSQLADDPEFKKALDEAAAVGMAAQTAIGLVRGFVQDWLARLL